MKIIDNPIVFLCMKCAVGILISILVIFPLCAVGEWDHVGSVLFYKPTGMSVNHDSFGNIKQVLLSDQFGTLKIELIWTTLGSNTPDPVRFYDTYFKAAKGRLRRVHGLETDQRVEMRDVLGQKMKVISMQFQDSIHEVGLCIMEKSKLVYEATYSAQKKSKYALVINDFLRKLQLIGSVSSPVQYNTLSTVSSFEQPDYYKWKSIKPGMLKEQIRQLIGKPDLIEGDEKSLHVWRKAVLVPVSDVIPVPYSFELHFSGNKLVSKSDPFNGRFSIQTRPTSPLLITPLDGQVFKHYPRIMDFRWYPVSGEYPMSYIVEVGIKNMYSNEWLAHQRLTCIPYLNIDFAATNRGRWRVRAVNKHGMSDWSAYRYFEFRDGQKKQDKKSGAGTDNKL